MSAIVQFESQSYTTVSSGFPNLTISFQNPTKAGNSIVFVAIIPNGSSSTSTFAAPTDTQGLLFNKVTPDICEVGGFYQAFTGGYAGYTVLTCCMATGTLAAGDTISFSLPSDTIEGDAIAALAFIYEVEGTPSFDTSASNYSTDPDASSFSSGAISPVNGYFEAAAFITNQSIVGQVAMSNGWTGEALWETGGTWVSSVIGSATQTESSCLFFPLAGTLSGYTIAGIWAFKALVYSISGNAGIAGANVSYSGTASGSVTADASGNYSITGLSAGNYNITPSLSGYAFSPTNQSETITTANISGVNFTATLITVPSTRFRFIERPSTTPGATLYDVVDSGDGKLVGQLFWDNILAQAWSFNLRDNQPYIAAGSSDAGDIENFATSLTAPAGITTVQPGPTPSTRFQFTPIVRRNGQPALQYLVADGPSIAYGSIGQIVWDGVFDRWTLLQTNAESQISAPSDVACITGFAASLALITPNQISL